MGGCSPATYGGASLAGELRPKGCPCGLGALVNSSPGVDCSLLETRRNLRDSRMKDAVFIDTRGFFRLVGAQGFSVRTVEVRESGGAVYLSPDWVDWVLCSACRFLLLPVNITPVKIPAPIAIRKIQVRTPPVLMLPCDFVVVVVGLTALVVASRAWMYIFAVLH